MLGIILGGIITTFIGWEYIFFINLPIGIVATILGYRYVQDTKRVDAKLDVIGMLLLSITLCLFSYGAVDFATEGVTSYNIAVFCSGAIFSIIFILFELRTSTQ